MKIQNPLFCLLIIVVFSSTAVGNERINRRYSFENNVTEDLSTKRLTAPYSGNITTDFARKGNASFRFELRNGDFVSDGNKAELRDMFSAAMGKEIWYGLSILIPEDFAIEKNNSCVMAQWHDNPDSAYGEVPRYPPLAFRYRGHGRFDVTVSYDPEKKRVQKENDAAKIKICKIPNFPRGVWHDFVVQVKWSHSTDGFLRVWNNRNLIADYTGPIGYNDESGPYFKFGIYCSNSPPVSKPLIMYHDEYSRGESFEGVDPSRELDILKGHKFGN